MHGVFQAGASYPWTVNPHNVSGPKETWNFRAFNCQTGAEFIAPTHGEAVAHTQAATGHKVELVKGEAAHA